MFQSSIHHIDSSLPLTKVREKRVGEREGAKEEEGQREEEGEEREEGKDDNLRSR